MCHRWYTLRQLKNFNVPLVIHAAVTEKLQCTTCGTRGGKTASALANTWRWRRTSMLGVSVNMLRFILNKNLFGYISRLRIRFYFIFLVYNASCFFTPMIKTKREAFVSSTKKSTVLCSVFRACLTIRISYILMSFRLLVMLLEKS